MNVPDTYSVMVGKDGKYYIARGWFYSSTLESTLAGKLAKIEVVRDDQHNYQTFEDEAAVEAWFTQHTPPKVRV